MKLPKFDAPARYGDNPLVSFGYDGAPVEHGPSAILTMTMPAPQAAAMVGAINGHDALLTAARAAFSLLVDPDADPADATRVTLQLAQALAPFTPTEAVRA
jgi:hypothetical protein